MKKIRNMDVEWSYSGDRGTEHWHTLCDWFAQGAAFPDQSPIMLSEKIIDEKKSSVDSLTFHYIEETFTEKEFKNTMHFVPPNTESYVVHQNQQYRLTDIHFHTPSEHLLQEVQYPIEFHLVHMNEEGQNLVVGCLFELVDKTEKFSKLKRLLEVSERAHDFVFNPVLFLPNERTHYHYIGSLTTPPTKGPIPWFVFRQVEEIDRQLVKNLKKDMLEFNNRPIQSRNKRKIYLVE
ncbi:carbonic anhydrase family protein [Enterococcus sp. BWB1-3]|uniref:carbonic anhydrase family protein n=1 Tax=unclassified Enterococcus TaxID=2608891 RepID=UPI001923D4F5|nr:MULTISPECIES: carbonic anhydrase family protein [unclassified Enterococcus]MBL1228561.1 carbonic anhydrase family protein [Enterococcus sp. BWB1-3]MCB5950566.1 carbonic anhydrase family protein [Enterococcus sp. BWT-B8]